MARAYLARSWIDPRQKFRTSPIHGIGSFARAPIRQGEVVEIVGGVVTLVFAKSTLQGLRLTKTNGN